MASKLWVYGLCLMLMLSLALAVDVNINCGSTSVNTGSPLTCTVALSGTVGEVSTYNFVINPGILFTITDASCAEGYTGSFGSVQKKLACATGSHKAPTTLATVILTASTAGSGVIGIGSLGIKDYNGKAIAGVIPKSSSLITVTKSETCTPKPATCAAAGIGCPGSTVIAQITCPSRQTCNDGACVRTPQCTNKQCGDDSCGGSCGTCLTGQTCNTQGTCVDVPTVVTLAADTPASAEIAQGDTGVDFTKIKMDVKSKYILERVFVYGVNVNNLDVSQLMLYNENNDKIAFALVGANPNDDFILNLGTPLTLPAGTPEYFLLKADISPTANVGDKLSLGVQVPSSVGGSFYGNKMTVTKAKEGGVPPTQTIGQRIDEALGADKTTKTPSLSLLSKIASIIKAWFAS
ncbi:hypothetical protein HZC32_03885 [Candidatus Woesearchaeota archaeon]|nr:hypothetical protein [Candidatus Woesearchaeota archaeon]